MTLGIERRAAPPVARASHSIIGLGACLRRCPWGRVAFILSLAVVYSCWATAFTGQFRVAMGYYDALANAFAAGQLHLLPEPSPDLLALPDPYDPAQNYRLRLHDASLYGGHYYLYWGPFPAVFHLLVKVLTGSMLPESIVQMAAATVASLAFWLILRRLRHVHLSQVPEWLINGCTLAFSFGGIALFLVGRPLIYHEALSIAMALLFVSWYALLRAFEHTHAATRRRLFVLGGCLLAAAIASRITYIGYIVGPGLVLLVRLLGAGPKRARLSDLASFAAPLAVTGLLLAWYNLARFGSPFEFGMTYALQGSEYFYRSSRPASGVGMGSFLDPRFLPLNVTLLLFSIPRFDLAWPYVSYAYLPYTGTVAFTFPRLDGAPAVYLESPIISVVALAPISLLGVLAPVALWRRPHLFATRALVLSVGLGSLSTLALVAASRGLSTRYSADFAPSFVLLGSIGVMLLWTRATDGVRHKSTSGGTLVRAARGLLTCFACCAWVLSLVIGVALGVGAWQYAAPAQSDAVQAFSDDVLSPLAAILLPWSVQSWADPVARPAWQSNTGMYRPGATVYLRAPQDRPSLLINLSNDLPAATRVHVTVNDATITDVEVSPGDNTILTPALDRIGARDLVRVQLWPDDQSQQAQTALRVHNLWLSRGPAEGHVYVLADQLGRITESQRAHIEQQEALIQHDADRIKAQEQALQDYRAQLEALKAERQRPESELSQSQK